MRPLLVHLLMAILGVQLLSPGVISGDVVDSGQQTSKAFMALGKREIPRLRDLVIRDPIALRRWPVIVDHITTVAADQLRLKNMMYNDEFEEAVLQSILIWYQHGAKRVDLLQVLRNFKLDALANEIEEEILTSSATRSSVWFNVGEIAYNFAGRTIELASLTLTVAHLISCSQATSTLVILFIWRARGQNIGHVSLYIPEQYSYISFWPNENVSGANAALYVESTTQRYDQDKESEGREEDEKHELTVTLNLSRMERRWNEIKEKTYSLAWYNCADAVMDVLTAGYQTFDSFMCLFPVSGGVLTLPRLEMLLKFADEENRKISAMALIGTFKATGVYSAVTRYRK